ncbi:MAG: N-6 DNA methylase [Kiritimatiellae bacterium]|nr:N-6 DNA methylase [Kiritimatiellia bacterium]
MAIESALQGIEQANQQFLYGIFGDAQWSNKNKPDHKKGRVHFVDTSDQIRVGRAQNFLEPSHVQQIYECLTRYEDVANYVKVVELGELKENDYNLNTPLYVEKIIEDNLPSVEEALADLKTAWDESLKAEERFKAILARFV